MTHKTEWNRRHGHEASTSHSLASLAKQTKFTKKTLQEVYNRGVGAHSTNPQSVRVKGTYAKNPNVAIKNKLSPEQWGYARVYAFLNKTDKGALNHDLDLA